MPRLKVKLEAPPFYAAVDRCYRSEPFPSDRARVEHLFALYEKLTVPLVPSASAKPKRARKAIAAKPIPPGRSTPQPKADAAHFYSAKEESPPYRAE